MHWRCTVAGGGGKVGCQTGTASTYWQIAGVGVGLGIVASGITGLDVAGAPVPTALLAVTANRYVVPLVKPVIVTVVLHPFVQLQPTCAGIEVMLYETIGEPPSWAGGTKVTVAWPLPATAVTLGGSGAEGRATTALESELQLTPRALVAVAVNV